MKNKKLFTLLVIVVLSTLALTACDGTIPEGLNLEEYLLDSTSLNDDSDDDSNAVLNDNLNNNEDGPDENSSDDDNNIEIKAEVTEVTANTISFNNETFTVETSEDLTTLFTSGDYIEIKYLVNEDGSITILEFELEDGIDDDSDDDMYDDDYSMDDSSNDDHDNDNYNDDYDDNDDHHNNNDSSNDDNDNKDEEDND